MSEDTDARTLGHGRILAIKTEISDLALAEMSEGVRAEALCRLLAELRTLEAIERKVDDKLMAEQTRDAIANSRELIERLNDCRFPEKRTRATGGPSDYPKP